MVPKVIKCDKCGANINVDSWKKFTVCEYCGDRQPFEGFDYYKINKKRSEYAAVKYEMDCPKCRSRHMFLWTSKWKCEDCGYTIPKGEKDRMIFWFCDDCEAYLNIQNGFTTETGKWKCTECGCNCGVSKADIL